ncbi:hypothetical protein HK102_009017 [Quaeritorhiza haematococci]|nr:hypothetical protein HK102_009017 [Quaeritorhiza haematococci]
MVTANIKNYIHSTFISRVIVYLFYQLWLLPEVRKALTIPQTMGCAEQTIGYIESGKDQNYTWSQAIPLPIRELSIKILLDLGGGKKEKKTKPKKKPGRPQGEDDYEEVGEDRHPVGHVDRIPKDEDDMEHLVKGSRKGHAHANPRLYIPTLYRIDQFFRGRPISYVDPDPDEDVSFGWGYRMCRKIFEEVKDEPSQSTEEFSKLSKGKQRSLIQALKIAINDPTRRGVFAIAPSLSPYIGASRFERFQELVTDTIQEIKARTFKPDKFTGLSGRGKPFTILPQHAVFGLR